MDHTFSSRDQFSARYSLYDVHATNSRGVGGLSTVSAAAGLSDLDQTVAVSNVYTISSRTVNETRGQFTNSNLLAPPNDAIGPAVSISGVASFGRLSASPTGRLDRLFEVVDNVSHQAGDACAARRNGFSLQRFDHHVPADDSQEATLFRAWRLF